MHDRLFKFQKSLEPWEGHARALGLDVAEFSRCLGDGKHAAAVRADMAQARSAGATGTPTFVLAETDAADPSKVKGISFFTGAKPFASFKAEIDGALAKLR